MISACFAVFLTNICDFLKMVSHSADPTSTSWRQWKKAGMPAALPSNGSANPTSSVEGASVKYFLTFCEVLRDRDTKCFTDLLHGHQWGAMFFLYHNGIADFGRPNRSAIWYSDRSLALRCFEIIFKMYVTELPPMIVMLPTTASLRVNILLTEILRNDGFLLYKPQIYFICLVSPCYYSNMLLLRNRSEF